MESHPLLVSTLLVQVYVPVNSIDRIFVLILLIYLRACRYYSSAASKDESADAAAAASGTETEDAPPPAPKRLTIPGNWMMRLGDGSKREYIFHCHL